MRRVLLECLVLFVGVVSNSTGQQANTISVAYDEAFANPKGFEFYLLERDDSFYVKFAKCAQLATPILTRMENGARQEHSQCTENSECEKIAKEIGAIAEARGNVQTLAAYLAGMHRGSSQDFAKSEAGRRALGGFEILRNTTGLDDDQATALIRQTPAYVGVLRVLESVPCQ